MIFVSNWYSVSLHYHRILVICSVVVNYPSPFLLFWKRKVHTYHVARLKRVSIAFRACQSNLLARVITVTVRVPVESNRGIDGSCNERYTGNINATYPLALQSLAGRESRPFHLWPPRLHLCRYELQNTIFLP